MLFRLSTNDVSIIVRADSLESVVDFARDNLNRFEPNFVDWLNDFEFRENEMEIFAEDALNTPMFINIETEEEFVINV